MDEARLAEAEKAYAAGDYRTAAKAFLSAAGRSVVGSGRAYHRAGNALLKLRRYEDAITVYGHALRDITYGEQAAVWANMGMAYLATGMYDRAVAAFDTALADSRYHTPWKALQGKAGALFHMGRNEEACAAYHEAARAPGNPDAGKSWNNLGQCWMSVRRPVEAVEAFRSALATEGYRNKGKAAANLGLAYAAIGREREADAAFSEAVEGFGFELTAAMKVVYDDISRRVHGAKAAPDVVEGWVTGEMPPVVPAEAAERPAAEDPEADATAGEVRVGSTEEVDAFFSITDEEMKAKDREARRIERAERRQRRSPWLIVAAVLVGIAVLGAGVTAAFLTGLGYPTQAQTVSGLLEARKDGKRIDGYWIAQAASEDVGKDMSSLPPTYRDFKIDRIRRSAQTSKADVTVVLEKGTPLHYTISLTREGAGWKVVGVANDWGSSDGGL